MTGIVTIDPTGIVALLNEPESLAVLDQAANDIQTRAAATTRRGHSAHRLAVADSYVTDRAHPGPDGGEAAVFSASPFQHFVEFGSIHQAPERPLTTAVTDAGYQREDVAKQ